MKTILFIALIIFFNQNILPSQPYFQKVTSGEIVNTQNLSNMSAWGDYDNDGDHDVVISSLDDSCGSCPNYLLFFNNNGEGTFTRVTNTVITQQNIAGSGLTWADYDNDGYLDLFVCGTINSRNKLFHNEGNGQFTLVTTGIIVNDVPSWSQGSAWADYNRDGWIDLFVANRFQSNFLYKNNGDGTFTKILSGSIVNDYGSSRACAWGDYNNDFWQDLFVLNYDDGAKDFLYRNNGDGTFTRVLNQPMVMDEFWGSSCSWIDYDNNGYLDLFVTNTGGGQSNRLYHNEGSGNFTLSNSILNQTSNSYGFSWGDYDNNGLTDLFMCNRGQINSLYINNGGSSFTKITNEIAGQEGVWSVTNTFVDYNKDGKLDLFVTNRFNNPYNYLYKNVGNTLNYVTIKLNGCENKFGIGARIYVYTGNTYQMKEASSGSGWGASYVNFYHFGVGDASIIDSVLVAWPSSDIAIYYDVNVNTSYLANECNGGELVRIEAGNNLSTVLSLDYRLSQNYPNPFNPSTRIDYFIPVSGHVMLKIFDINGKLVSTLVDEYKSAGNYIVDFNSKTVNDGLASGIYFYKLISGDFVSVNKMTLLK